MMRFILPIGLGLLFLMFLSAPHLVLAAQVKTNLEFGIPSEDYPFNIELKEDSAYHVFWKYDKTNITFEVHVKTAGWIGLGLSSNGAMKGSDIVVGWVDNGQAVLSDRHGLPKVNGYNVKPAKDPSQDYELLAHKQTDIGTVLKFRRKLVTCDSNDMRIREGTVRLIWAYSGQTPTSEDDFTYHQNSRGVRSVNLLEVVTPVSLPKDVRKIDFLNPNISVPDKDTTYWCQAFVLPKLNRKHHLIRWEPVVKKGHEALVHHIVIYECRHPVNRTAIRDYGSVCYNPNMPENLVKCNMPVIAWGVGGKAFNFPPQVGYSFGSTDDVEVVVMETHFDNPSLREDYVDSSGMRLYLTQNIRQYDATTLTIGRSLQGLFVPPKTHHRTVSVCPKACLDGAMRAKNVHNITVFATFLHSHLLGRRLVTRHIRDGKQIGFVGRDDHYDFNYQETRSLKPFVVIQPGDELVLECDYDSGGRRLLTTGGLGTKNEMCFNFVQYYPNIDLFTCTSSPNFPVKQLGRLASTRVNEQGLIMEGPHVNKSFYKSILSQQANFTWNQHSYRLFQHYDTWSDNSWYCGCGQKINKNDTSSKKPGNKRCFAVPEKEQIFEPNEPIYKTTENMVCNKVPKEPENVKVWPEKLSEKEIERLFEKFEEKSPNSVSTYRPISGKNNAYNVCFVWVNLLLLMLSIDLKKSL